MSAPSALTFASKADQHLFRALVQNPNHVIRKLLPEVRQTNYDLHPRTHKIKLSIKDEIFLSYGFFTQIKSN